MKLKLIILWIGALSPLFLFSQSGTDSLFWKNLLDKYPNPLISRVLTSPDTFKTQIIYTEIDRVGKKVLFTNHNYNVNDTQYFYPASVVKLPLLLQSLEKVNEIHNLNPSIDMGTSIKYEASGKCQVNQMEDETNLDYKRVSIWHFIKRILLVSDNSAYNRLYEFCGQDELNQSLIKKGLSKTKIIQRFWPGCDSTSNACTNGIRFFNLSNQELYYQQLVCSKFNWINSFTYPFLGKGVKYGNRIYPKLNARNMNSTTLQDIHGALQRLVHPENFSPEQRFQLEDDQRRLVLKYASMYCTSSENPVYKPQNGYFPAYKKYLYYGRSPNAPIDSNIKIFNIVGWSYGYLIDCAYIIDLQSGKEFYLSALIYCNKDDILNDDIYNYSDIGFPFLEKLGRTIVDYERGTGLKNGSESKEKLRLTELLKEIEK